MSMNIRYRGTLTLEERHHLETLTSGGTRAARQIKRAQKHPGPAHRASSTPARKRA